MDLDVLTNLQKGHSALKKHHYAEALDYYQKSLAEHPALAAYLQFNIDYCQYLQSQCSLHELVQRSHASEIPPNYDSTTLIVYSCNFGNYETVKEPDFIQPGVQYIMFTDNPKLTSKAWDIRLIDKKLLSPSRASRLAKILAHKYLPEHDVSLYIDSSITLKSGDIKRTVLTALGDSHLAFYPHFERQCIFEEVETCISLRKVNKDKARQYLKKVKANGFPKQFGLVENAVIVRKNSLLTKRINELWFDLYYNNEPRDQFYLMYVLWLFDAPFSLFKDSTNFRSSPWLGFISHRHQDRNQKPEVYQATQHFASGDFVSNHNSKHEKTLQSIFERAQGSIMEKTQFNGKWHNYYKFAVRVIAELEHYGTESVHHFRRVLASKVLFGHDSVIKKSVQAQVHRKIGYIPSSPMPTAAANNVHVMKMCSAVLSKGHQVAIYAEQVDMKSALKTRHVHDYFHVNPQLSLQLIPSTDNKEKNALNLVLAALEDGCDRIFTRSIDVAIIAAIIDVPVVLELHKELQQNSWFKLDFLVKSPAFEGLVLITEALALKFKGYSKTLNKKLVVLPDAADEPPANLALFPLVANPKAVLHVGYVGHLYPGKGAELAAELARITPHVHFHMLGGLPEDVAKWQAETQSLSNITFYGHRPPAEVPSFIQTVDVAVAPFLRNVGVNGSGHNIADVFSPLKIFEYMALGKAIVCSNLPVIREVLTHYNNAILCNPDNLEEWQQAFDVLIQNKTLKERLENAAKQDFLQHYTWASRADKLIELLAPTIDLSSGLEQLNAEPLALQTGRKRPLIKWFFGGKKQVGWAYGINAKRISSYIDNCDHIFDDAESDAIPDIAIAFDVLIKETEAFKNCGARRKVMRVGGPNPLKVLCGGNEELLREKLSDVDAIICLSPQLRDYVREFHEQVFFIPNGIDLNKFNPKKVNRRADRAKLVVGMSASMKNEFQKHVKGYYYAKEACENLGAELFVVGRGFNHIEHGRLIEDFYSQIDIFLHPVGPGKEASSNVTMEALALGIPVVTTRYNGFHGHAIPQSYSCTVPRNTVYLSAEMNRITLELSEEIYASKGLRFCEVNHEIKSVSKKYETCLLGEVLLV